MSRTERSRKPVPPNARALHGAGPGDLKFAHVLVFITFIASLVVLLAPYDGPVAQYFKNSAISHRVDTGWLKWVLREPGEYGLAIVTAILLLLFHPQTWRAAGMMLLSGVPGILNGMIKWAFGRARPFKSFFGDGRPWHLDPFHGGIGGLFHQVNLSFTSGHTTQAFAWAELLSIAVPVLRVPAYLWALWTAFQRVASTDHYLTDAVAAAWLGVVTVRLTFRILSNVVPAARHEVASRNVVRPGRAELAAMSEMSPVSSSVASAPAPETRSP